MAAGAGAATLVGLVPRGDTTRVIRPHGVPVRGARAALCALLLVATGACFPAARPGDEPTGREQTAQAQIRALFERRADALVDGSAERYLRPLSPAARSFEEPIAAGAGKLPLAGARIVVREADVAPDGRSVDDARIDFVYWFDGLAEDNLFHIFLVNDLRRRGSRWVVTSSAIDRSRYPMDPGSALPLWATGPFETARSEHFLALYRPGLGGIQTVMRLAERAYAQLLPRLTFDPEPGYLMVLAADAEEYDELVGEDMGASSIAVAVAEYARASGRGTGGFAGVRPETRHMVVNLEAAAGGAPVEGHAHPEQISARRVIQHELGHLALERVTSPFTPGWVKEGAAMYLAGERRVEEWRGGLAEGAFERLSYTKLSPRGSVKPRFGYAYVNAGALHLVERFGAGTFFDFYRGFRDFEVLDVKPMRSVRAERTQRLLNLMYGTTERELDEATRTYIDEAVR